MECNNSKDFIVKFCIINISIKLSLFNQGQNPLKSLMYSSRFTLLTVSGGDSVDMDWLKHFTEQVIAGVQVIVLNDPNTAPNTTPGAHFDNQNKSRAKGPGRNIGRRLVEGVDDEGLVAHMRAEEKVRAKPTKHIISSDELAEMIDNLKPDDQMSNHVKINEANCKGLMYILNHNNENDKRLKYIQFMYTWHLHMVTN